ncbi:MAG: glutaminase A [Pseudomonadota bacterium]
MQALLETIAAEVRPLAADGRPARYIPALAEVDPKLFAVAVETAEGESFAAGDADEPFSIQSISKLFALALAMERIGDPLWDRVKREPSGMRFNSIIQLETEAGVPRNPFINAGAIVVADALLDDDLGVAEAMRDLMRGLSGDASVDYDRAVHRSEIATGDMNRAAAFLLKAKGNLRADPIDATELYFGFCSLAMSARALARAARFLIAPDEPPLGRHALRLRALMRTCGLYDQSGEFAFRVGLPAKSGVGGGIVAVNAAKGYVACAWSPPLDEYGNSIAATAALERLAAATGV